MSLMKKEREITEPVKLCDENGNLNAASVGWSRRPLITSNLKGQFLRKKKWHYWCVNGQDALFSATISHLDYAAVCFVYYLDYKTKDFYEKTVLMPLGLKTNMPEEVLASAENLHKDMGIFFIWDGSDTHLKVSIPDFGGKPLKADIKVYYPENHDTLNVVIPWSKDEVPVHCQAKNVFRPKGHFLLVTKCIPSIKQQTQLFLIMGGVSGQGQAHGTGVQLLAGITEIWLA